MPLADKVKTITQAQPPKSTPVWAGPSGDGPNGGVTFSLLSEYLGCKERFRVHVIEGLKLREGFNHRLEFGNMWHLCEDAHGRGVDPLHQEPILEGSTEKTWGELRAYCEGLTQRYRTDSEEIGHWYEVTKALWPVYREYWDEVNPDETPRTPVLREQVFDIPYNLPSGRTVRLRGKMDGVDFTQDKRLWLYENKTKSQIDSDKIGRQLTFDLQTMMYLRVLRHYYDKNGWAGTYGPIAGVRYNVVRRSAHKTVQSMMKKVTEDYHAGRIGEWFARWEVEVLPHDYKVFVEQCFDPILENLLDDYEWWSSGLDPFDMATRRAASKYCLQRPMHFRLPYGLYNPVLEGGFGAVDEYLRTGSEIGLERVSNLFPELEV